MIESIVIGIIALELLIGGYVMTKEITCDGKGVILIKYLYGMVMICAKCETEHPILARHRETRG